MFFFKSYILLLFLDFNIEHEYLYGRLSYKADRPRPGKQILWALRLGMVMFAFFTFRGHQCPYSAHTSEFLEQKLTLRHHCAVIFGATSNFFIPLESPNDSLQICLWVHFATADGFRVKWTHVLKPPKKASTPIFDPSAVWTPPPNNFWKNAFNLPINSFGDDLNKKIR